MTADPAARAALLRGLAVAALLLLAALALRLLAPVHLAPEAAQRLVGALLGAVVVASSNAIPKALAPRLRFRDPAAEQALRRFAGWSLTLGGLGYVLAWLLAPLEHANAAAGLVLAASLLAVVVRVRRP